MPGLVQTRYDQLDMGVHDASPVYLSLTTTYERPNAFGRQGPEVRTETGVAG